MPTTLIREQRCAVCHTRKPRHQFSVANSICLECFDRSYAFCEECGEILYRHGQGITQSCHPSARIYNGQVVCDRCRNQLEYRRDGRLWPPTPFAVSIATYDRIGSKRKFGVEIETYSCANHHRCIGRFNFGSKIDCTVRGMEFDSPIMYGDEGLEHIEAFLAYGARYDWEVDGECGCHTHYDMRDESRDQLLSIAYAYRKTQLLWAKFLPSRRLDSSYSHTANWNLRDLRNVVNCGQGPGDWIGHLSCERYEMVNLTAYYDHRTFEVRSLEGTVDPETICNWIIVNCRFIDAVRDMTFAQIDDLFSGGFDGYFEALSGLIGDDDLIDWLKRRKERFNPNFRDDIPL